jgi:inhibitor of the pro-sigma K processing machinery
MAVTRVVLGPMKSVSRLAVNCALSLGTLMILNLVGSFAGFHLPMNPVTVAGVGLLGAPGLALLSVISFLLL